MGRKIPFHEHQRKSFLSDMQQIQSDSSWRIAQQYLDKTADFVIQYLDQYIHGKHTEYATHLCICSLTDSPVTQI